MPPKPNRHSPTGRVRMLPTGRLSSLPLLFLEVKLKTRKVFIRLAIILMLSLPVFVIAATQRFDTIIAKKVVVTGSGGLELGDGAGSFDVNGKELTLDADADSSITAETDDQLDFELGGQDELVFTASVFDLGEGTLTRIDLDADNDTSIRSSVDDQMDFELGGNDQFVLIGAAAADSGATNEYTEIALSSPADTTGTNTHNALTVDLAIGNSTAGTNTVTAIQIDAITDDPQVVEKAINIGDEWDYAIDTGLPVVATAMQWFDDFIGDAVLTQYTEINGSDGQAVQAIQEEQFGVYQITSGDAGTGVAADLEATYLSLEWQADQGGLMFETRLHLDSTITTTQVCAGFTDDVTTAELPFSVGGSDAVTSNASNAAMFCYDTGADTDEWFGLGVAGDTDATGQGATGTAPVTDTYQVLRIEIDDGGADCRFYIDGALAKTVTANCITPTALIAPGVVIHTEGGDTNSKVVDIDYLMVAAARD